MKGPYCLACGGEGVTMAGVCRTCGGLRRVPSPAAPVLDDAADCWRYAPFLAVRRHPVGEDEWVAGSVEYTPTGPRFSPDLYARSTSPDLTAAAREAIASVKRMVRP